jgi:hypothetical protein
MLVSSVYHRFWRSGLGLGSALARNLKPGDVLRTLEDQVRVVAIAPDDAVPVYNLDVSQKRTWSFGEARGDRD